MLQTRTAASVQASWKMKVIFCFTVQFIQLTDENILLSLQKYKLNNILRRCSDTYIISLFPHLHITFPPSPRP